MLKLQVRGSEFYDEEKEEFVYPHSFELKLEHSLVSLSKWEQKFEKPFLSQGEKSTEEVFGYIEAMALTDISEEQMAQLSDEDIAAINKYVDSKQTATWFNERPDHSRNSQIITAELIYYWMFKLEIDIECQNWHLNRLFTLIKVFSAQDNAKPGKKVVDSDALARRRALNQKRKAELGTTG